MPVRPPYLNQHLLAVGLESCSLYSCHSSWLIPAVLAALGAVPPGLFQTARVGSSIVNFPVNILDCYLTSLFRRYPLESCTRQLGKAERDCAQCTRLVRPCVPTLFSNRSFGTSKCIFHLRTYCCRACVTIMSDLPLCLLGLVMRVVSRPTKIEREETYIGARSHRQAIRLEDGHIIYRKGFQKVAG